MKQQKLPGDPNNANNVVYKKPRTNVYQNAQTDKQKPHRCLIWTAPGFPIRQFRHTETSGLGWSATGFPVIVSVVTPKLFRK